MAKVCCNCNKTMGLFEKGYKLPSVDACFCSSCSGNAGPLFAKIDGIDKIASGKYHRELEEEFLTALDKTELHPEAKRMAERHFRLKQLSKSQVTIFVRTFEGDFSFCYNALKSAAEAAVKTAVSANVVTAGEVKTALFLLEHHPVTITGDSMAIMAATLVWHDGKATVTCRGASDYFGNFRSLHYDFWRELELANPDLVVKDVWELDFST